MSDFSKSSGKETKFRLGIFSWFGYQIPYAERAAMVAEAGFEVSSIWWLGKDHPKPELLEAAPQILRDNNLAVDNIHVPHNKANSLWRDNEKAHSELMDMFLQAMDFCSEHKIPKIVLHLTTGRKPPEPNQKGIDTFGQILERAEQQGIILAVENVRAVDHIHLIMSEFSSSYLKFCYDSSHDFLTKAPAAASLIKFGHRLTTTHISDNDGKHDRHWPLFDGVVDFDVIAEKFPKDYSGALMLEILTRDTSQEPRDFLAKAYENLQIFASKIEKFSTKQEIT